MLTKLHMWRLFEWEIPQTEALEEPTDLDRAKQLIHRIEQMVRAWNSGELIFDDGKSTRFQSLTVRMASNSGERRGFGTKRIINFTKMTYVPLTDKKISTLTSAELQQLTQKPQDFFATRVSIAWNENRESFYCYAEKLQYHRSSDFQILGEPETVGAFRGSTLTNPVIISWEEALQILTNMEREIISAIRERDLLKQTDPDRTPPENTPDIERSIAFAR